MYMPLYWAHDTKDYNIQHFSSMTTSAPEAMETDAAVDLVGANENVASTVVVETSQIQPISQPVK